MDINAAIAETNIEVIRYRRLLKHMAVVRKNLHSIIEIKKALSVEDTWYAEQVWTELDNKTQLTLYQCAPTYGGIFTTRERTFLDGIGIEWQP